MMDVVMPYITKDHPSRIRRGGKSATSQIHLYKDKNLQCVAAHFSLNSLASSCLNLQKTVSPSVSSPSIHNEAPNQPFTLMTLM